MNHKERLGHISILHVSEIYELSVVSVILSVGTGWQGSVSASTFTAKRITT